MSLAPELIAEVQEWIALDPNPTDSALLQKWLDEENERELKAAFSGFLEFGTAGLRGPLGPGPSRMNRAVVHRTAAGLANYLIKRGKKSVVIGRDARYGSEDFTQESAEIFSGAGLDVYVLPRPLPTPVLAFAVNYLQVDAGVMVTASHNPPQDNGYKVYLGGEVDGVRYAGSQIISPADQEIASEIAAIKAAAVRGKTWQVLGEEIQVAYLERAASLVRPGAHAKVIYTAMHGVGGETLMKLFAHANYATPIPVTEQFAPNPDFPTVAFPNPEEPGAMDLALAAARNLDADVIIANDPDADRCAAAANFSTGGWRALRGDELGAIVGYYLATKQSAGNIGQSFANSIVSSSVLSKIAHKHQIEFHETLTGFKWLAKIPNLRFGYEEALGYAIDPKAVNDKDGISVALLIAQITDDLKREGLTLENYLETIWDEFGYHLTAQISIRVQDMRSIAELLDRLRNEPPTHLGARSLVEFNDLAIATEKLPATNGIRLYFSDGLRVIIRPSGTEPKMKCYLELISHRPAHERHLVDAELQQIRGQISELLSLN